MAGLQFRIFAGLPEEVLPLSEGVQVVGSAVRHGITLRHPSVAPEHFLVEIRGDTCRVAAVSGSLVYVNGIALGGRRELLPGDVLHAGPIGLLLEPAGAQLPIHHFIADGLITEHAPITGDSCSIGSSAECSIILPSAAIDHLHAEIRRTPDGLSVRLLSHSPDNLLNGRPFDQRPLLAGDHLSLGPFHLSFDGNNLVASRNSRGSRVNAESLSLTRSGARLLDRITLNVEPGELVAIVGPTGAGKSTLLGVLGGRFAPDSGQSTINGIASHLRVKEGTAELGWVPQEDIVHRDLTVIQALEFAARLRSSRGTREKEISNRVLAVAERVGLKSELATAISRLSGGERKKVSVGAELTGSPAVMFLDEPTSGLDPAAELRMVGTLRSLSEAGCTVIYTTHRMESLYLADRVVVLSAGLLVYEGTPEDCSQFFGVRTPSELFSRLEQRKASEWREAFRSIRPPSQNSLPTPPGQLGSKRRAKPSQTPILLTRMPALVPAEWRNALLLFGQPALIGLLLMWAVHGTLDDSALKLFFCGMATLWLGCSNGAQELVGERSIYCRERMAGLHQRAYISAKWLFVSGLTLVQAAIVYLIARIPGSGISGSWEWQVAGLAVIALVGSNLGLAISSLARNATQAVLLVPALLIPQIVLSGYTVPAADMTDGVRASARGLPTFQLQRILDTSLVWGQKIDANLLQSHFVAIENLRTTERITTGSTFTNAAPAEMALIILFGWLVVTTLIMMLGLRATERSQ